MGSGDGSGYTKFNQGDNALVKIQNLEPDTAPEGGEYGGGQLQLKMVFDAVSEIDDDESGRLPYWPNSKITISESDEHKSALGRLLVNAEILEDVLSDLGFSDEEVEMVVDGDARWEAEDRDENVELAKAVATHLKAVVLRVGTKQNNSGEYSKVDKVYGLADSDPFDDESVSGSSDESEQEEEDELFVEQ